MIVEEQEIPDPKVDEFHTNSQVIPNHCNPRLRQSPASLISSYLDLRNAEIYHRLMNDLTSHNWMAQGAQNMQWLFKNLIVYIWFRIFLCEKFSYKVVKHHYIIGLIILIVPHLLFYQN